MIEIIVAFLLVIALMYYSHTKEREHIDKMLSMYEGMMDKSFAALEKQHKDFITVAKDIADQKEAEIKERDIDLELERITRLDGEENAIEKQEEQEDPLADIDPAMIRNIKGVQFEGEENIYPIEVK